MVPIVGQEISTWQVVPSVSGVSNMSDCILNFNIKVQFTAVKFYSMFFVNIL